MKRFLLFFSVLCLVGQAAAHAQKEASPLGSSSSPGAASSPVSPPSPFSAAAFRPAFLPEDYFPAFVRPAVQLYNQGKYDRVLEATAALKKTKAGGRQPDKILFLEGMTYFALDRAQPAANAFRESMKTRRSNSDAYYFAALCLLQAGFPGDAYELLKEGIWFERPVLVPKEAMAYLRGVMVERVGEMDMAEKIYRGALTFNPRYVPAKIKLADLLFSQGEQTAAINALRQALNKDPSSEEIKVKLASMLLTSANRSLNKREVAQALELTSAVAAQKDPALLYQDPVFPAHVRALAANGKTAAAEKLLADAARAAPDNPDIPRLKRQLEIEKQADAALAAEGAAPAANP